MKKILIQCKRELLLFIRDTRTVMLAFLLPSVSMVLIGFAIRLEAHEMPMVVQNFDIGKPSRELVDRIFANNQVIRVNWPGGEPLRKALDTDIAKLAIVIPPEFSRKLQAGQPASISVLIDGTDVNNARVLKNGVLGTLGALTADPYAAPPPRVVPVTRIWFNPGRKEALYIIPGAFGFLLWVYPSLLAALSASRERELGTVLQIYSSSITPFEFIAGKILGYGFVGFAQAVVLYLVGWTVFGAHVVADLPGFLIGTAIFILSAVSFGVMAGNYAETQVVAVQIVANTGTTFSLLFSGYIVPLKEVVFPFNLISYIIPLKYHCLLSRDAYMRGAGWEHTWHLLLILFAFLVVLMIASWWRIHDMELEH